MAENPIPRWDWFDVSIFTPALNQRFNALALTIKRLLTGQRQASTTITASYTALPEDYLIRANATGGAITVTLPKAADQKGRILVVKKIDSSANAVTIDANGAETIDGATTLVASVQYATVTLQSNGTSWDTIATARNATATGTASSATFLRGDNTWSDTLTGTFSTGGTVGVGTPALTNAGLAVTDAALTGTSQFGAYVNQIVSAAATTAAYAINAAIRTTAAAYTVTSAFGVYISNASKGAGSAITTLYGLYIEAQTAGATNYAIFTAGTAPSTFGGNVTAPRFVGPATGLRETAGPTDLALGAVADGQYLKRSGATVIGGTPTATVAAPFTGNQATGSFTIATGQFGVQGARLTLASTDRATLEGTGRLVLCG